MIITLVGRWVVTTLVMILIITLTILNDTHFDDTYSGIQKQLSIKPNALLYRNFIFEPSPSVVLTNHGQSEFRRRTLFNDLPESCSTLSGHQMLASTNPPVLFPLVWRALSASDKAA